jgi:hypothetical protein
MPIYRCNQCGFVSEDATNPIGTKVPCGRCGTASTVYGTVFYVEKLVERYLSALREIQALQQADRAVEPDAGGTLADTPPPADAQAFDATDLTSAEQHAPLRDWFAARQVQAQFDQALVDTSGYFDDAAQAIGQRFDLFGELVDRVRAAYRKSFTWINLDLSKMSQKDAQAVNALCRQLYSHTFFARYHYQKAEKVVRLSLQPAPAVRQFFEGEWLEWFTFMEMLDQCRAGGRGFSCARGVRVVFSNEDLHELDVVFLPQGHQPVVIECKSGEFRRDIDKYVRLRKRLGLDRTRFVVCATDLSDEQARSLNAMYELSFVNHQTLKSHLATLA